jgi:CcmD family protein
MIDSETKLWVVALVLAIIFVGIVAFLFFLEYRIGKLEKKLRKIEKETQE